MDNTVQEEELVEHFGIPDLQLPNFDKAEPQNFFCIKLSKNAV